MQSQQSTYNPEEMVLEFERRFARFVGAADCLATSSGTAALHLALIGLGIGPEDTVLLPVTTFVATTNAVLYTGAKIEFADVDPLTWTLPPQSLRNSEAKTAILVHLYGVPCEIPAPPARMHIIEDCAEALGSTYRGNHVGHLGDCAAFSFNLNKTLTTGGGGALIGNDGFPLDMVRHISRQAKAEDGSHWTLGYNYRMNAEGADFGIQEFELLSLRLARQRTINSWYRKWLGDIVQFQEPTMNSDSAWWYTACLLPEWVPPERLCDAINRQVNSYERPARRVFRPLCDSMHLKCEDKFPVARTLWERGLCLPSSHNLTESDIMRVCRIVRLHCER